LKLSIKAFCIGLPGAMWCHATRLWSAHARMALLVSSQPLSPTTILLGLSALDHQPRHADAGERGVGHTAYWQAPNALWGPRGGLPASLVVPSRRLASGPTAKGHAYAKVIWPRPQSKSAQEQFSKTIWFAGTVERFGRGQRVNLVPELREQFLAMKKWLWRKSESKVLGRPTHR
jgi:hypothetical protein